VTKRFHKAADQDLVQAKVYLDFFKENHSIKNDLAEARDDKSWSPSWGKQLPGERPRETAET
jgi:hypothetical protein